MLFNDNIERKYYASMSYGLDSTFVRPATKRSQLLVKIIQLITFINIHTPSSLNILITTIRGSKMYSIFHSFSLRRKLTQNPQIQSLSNKITKAKTHTHSNRKSK